MEHKKIKVKGGIVHYWIDRAEKSQSCIVFSHGVTADHTMFEKQIAYCKTSPSGMPGSFSVEAGISAGSLVIHG